MIIKIEIDEYDLWNILIDAISDGAKWPECYRAVLPANRIMHKLKSRCAEYFKKENANSGYPLLGEVRDLVEVCEQARACLLSWITEDGKTPMDKQFQNMIRELTAKIEKARRHFA